jgi:hypothetical protein
VNLPVVRALRRSGNQQQSGFPPRVCLSAELDSGCRAIVQRQDTLIALRHWDAVGSRAHVQVSRENVADDRLGVAQRLGKLVRANVAAGERETGNRRPANFGPGSQPGTAVERPARRHLEQCPQPKPTCSSPKSVTTGVVALGL